MSKIQAMFPARGRRIFDSERADAAAFYEKYGNQAATPKEKTMNEEIAPESQRREDSMRRLALEHACTANGLVTHHPEDIVAAAQQFYDFMTGKPESGEPRIATMDVTTRLAELEEMVRSACAIADRKGESTSWERFLGSAAAMGLNGVTARTYRILPSDAE